MRRSLLLAFIITMFAFTPIFAQQSLFTQVDRNAVGSNPDIRPLNYQVFQIDDFTRSGIMEQVSINSGDSSFEIEIPYPDGTLKRFTAEYSSVMHPSLAARFPEIRTFTLQGIDSRASSGRMSITEHGIHASVYGPGYTMYLDPYNRENNNFNISYYRQDLIRTFEDIMSLDFDQQEPIIHDQAATDELQRMVESGDISILNSGTQLRTYRIAIAANRFYTNFHGGTVSGALAAIAIALNRINSIYEREIAVRLVLIENNDQIIYTNDNPGPYGNAPGGAILQENVSNLNQVIESANYDIGHVFITGGGGVAALNSVCTGSKAAGVTGLPQPINDPFYVDYVSHEIGHQFGAPHTFNGSTGGCANNRSANSAYEPGSGSTIMAYSGLCGGQNIQFSADDYFHNASYSFMRNFITNGAGSTCGQNTSTGNNAPTVAINSESKVFPILTPFTLTGEGSDPDGDELTFTWEQYDRGPQGAPNSPVGNAPIFRTFPGTTNPSRTFPRMENVLSGSQTLGERLPDYQRNLTFRLTARDNVSGGGGVAFAQVQHTTTANAGPFLVPVPGQTTAWPSGGNVFVAWDVANTNVAPVNAQFVNIKLSTNGGQSFDVVLAENIPNNGYAEIELPTVNTQQARIKVEAADHYFFNVNPSNFSIESNPPQSEINLSSDEFDVDVSDVDVTTFALNISNSGSNALNYFVDIVENEDSDLPFLPIENISLGNQVGSIRANQNRDVAFNLIGSDLEEGSYSFVIRLISDNSNQSISEIPVTANVRIQQEFSNLFVGQNGWRLIATPAESTTLSNIFSNFRTQGFTGADDDDDELLPNVYQRGTSGLLPVNSIDTEVPAGRGIASYLFSNQLPRIMRVNGFDTKLPLEISMQSNIVFPLPGTDGVQERGWNLLGNPKSGSLDLKTLPQENFVNMNRAVYVWRANLNQNRGGYQIWNGLDVVNQSQYFNGVIRQFEAFFMQAAGTNAKVTLDDISQTNDENLLSENLDYAYYTLEITGEGFTNYATILLTNESTNNVDSFDAVQLRSLSGEYLNFYTPHNNRAFAIRSLPLNYDGGTVSLPYQVESTASGEFTIRVLETGGSIDNFQSLQLRDNETNETVTLLVGETYSFEMEATADAPEPGVNALDNLIEHRANTSDPRFNVSVSFGTATNIEDDLQNPLSYELAQNYPNPFNPTTVISYNLPDNSTVNLEVYDMLGRRVATLVNTTQSAGSHTAQFDASSLSSGVYIYRLQTEHGVLSRKMMLVK